MSAWVLAIPLGVLAMAGAIWWARERRKARLWTQQKFIEATKSGDYAFYAGSSQWSADELDRLRKSGAL